MNITRLALENNRTTWVLIIALLFFGIASFDKMPKDYDPGFIIRTAQVVTYFPGASPHRVEELVTDKIEKVVQQIPELDFVSSTSKTGVSIVSVNIKESYKNMRPIWDNLRRKIESVENELPSDAQKPIVNDEFGDVFGVVIGLTAEGFSYREMEEVAEQVRDELLRLPEAAKVDIFGAQEQRVFIEFENAKLASMGISPGQLKDLLASRNIVYPGGSIYIDDETFIDFFILNELSNNVDGYRLSTYLTKNRDEKLKIGPIWDFNLSFGNAFIILCISNKQASLFSFVKLRIISHNCS